MRSSFGVLGVAGRVSSFVQPIPEGQGSSRRNLFGVNLPRTASSPTPMHVEGRDGAFARLGRRYSFQQGIGPPTTLGATHHGILLGGSTSEPEGVAAAAVASAVAPLPTTTAAAAGPSSALVAGWAGGRLLFLGQIYALPLQNMEQSLRALQNLHVSCFCLHDGLVILIPGGYFSCQGIIDP